MKRSFLVSALAFGFIGSAHAGINFNIDTPYMTTTLPVSGTISVTFTGTVDVLLAGVDAVNFGGDFPGLTGTGPFLLGTIDSGFAAYLSASAPGVDYTGALFTITVSSTDLPGNYFYNNGGNSGFSEVFVDGNDGSVTFTDSEVYGLTVNPVPEPATMAVLGLGAAALLRRRRK